MLLPSHVVRSMFPSGYILRVGECISDTWHGIWSTMFNQCYITVFFRINFKIKGWGSNTKRWGNAMLPPFGGTTEYISLVPCTENPTLESLLTPYLSLLSHLIILLPHLEYHKQNIIKHKCNMYNCI